MIKHGPRYISILDSRYIDHIRKSIYACNYTTSCYKRRPMFRKAMKGARSKGDHLYRPISYNIEKTGYIFMEGVSPFPMPLYMGVIMVAQIFQYSDRYINLYK